MTVRRREGSCFLTATGVVPTVLLGPGLIRKVLSTGRLTSSGDKKLPGRLFIASRHGARRSACCCWRRGRLHRRWFTFFYLGRLLRAPKFKKRHTGQQYEKRSRIQDFLFHET